MTGTGSQRARRIRELRSARRAQMPFSIVAVLILVLSSTSIALVYGLETKKESTLIPERALEELKRSIELSGQDVERIAYSSAYESISQMEDLNETGAQERFLASLNRSLEGKYPGPAGNVQVSVKHELRLIFLRASLEEVDAVAAGVNGVNPATSVPAYFTIIGNYSLNASRSDGHLTRTVEMDQEIYSPLPLLFDRMQHLASVTGPRGDLESVVRYELSALAQDRVLRGYGMAAKTGSASTEAIITSEDVVRAVNLALVLEQLRYFHAANGTMIDELLGGDTTLDGEGQIDPADLFLRSYDEGGLDLVPLVSQAIYARADAVVLRWLDYLGLIDIAGGLEDTIEGVGWGLTDAIDHLTGGDTAQANVIGYLSGTMDEAGVPQYDYRWSCYGSPDVLVDLPARKICFFDDQGNKVYHTFQGTHSVDFPAVDLFASPEWGDFYREYRSSTHQLAQQMRSYLESIASCVASHCSIPSLDLLLDPSDGRSYLDEIDGQLRRAFLERPLWLKPALDKASEVMRVRDGLAQGIMDFMDGHWAELLEMNRSVQEGALGLSHQLAWELNGTGGFSSASIGEAQRIIYAELLGDVWGSREAIGKAFAARAETLLDRVDDGLSRKSSAVDPLIKPLAFGLSSLPGIELVTSDALLSMVDDLRSVARAQGGTVQLPVSADGLALTLADGQQRTEAVQVGSSMLGPGSGTGSITVQIKEPWEYDRSNSSYPNRHVTDLLNVTATPYQTQWEIGYRGSFRVLLTPVEGGGREVASTCSSTFELQGSLTVITSSGWALKGVSYAPTTTLAKDVERFLQQTWDFLVSVVQAVGGMASKAFSILSQLVSDLLSFATKPLEVLNQLLASAMEALERTATSLLGSVVGALSDVGQAALNGTTIDLSVLGTGLSLTIGPSDTYLPGTEDRMRMDLTMSCPGATVLASIRVLRLPDGQHTIAGTANLGGDDWSVEMTLDPLTKVYQHQVEVRGFLGDHLLELFAPEAERVQKVSVALHDVPGLGAVLDQIPSPVPGTKFHVDGGMEMCLNVVDRQNLVINEVELNPPGRDSDREWVELFNPLDHAVDVNGWSLATSRGRPHSELLSGTVPAHGYYVHVFEGQALDNGDVRGFPLHESVALLDKEGNRVDAAPWLKDLNDDSRTWQRAYDGSDHWEFREGTRGSSNGFVLFQAPSTDGLASVMGQCFEHALAEALSGRPDAGTLSDIIKKALGEMEERLLDSLGQTISSLRLFIELGLQDASGSVGGGLTLGIRFDGAAVKDCVRWTVDAIGELLQDPLNPLAAGARAAVPTATLAEHVFMQAGAYLSVGTPKMVLNPVGPRIRAEAVVEANLEALGCLRGDGEWEVNFGIVLPTLTVAQVKGQTGASAKDSIDLWVLRGSLRPA